MSQELTDVRAGFRKGRGNRDQIAIIHWIIEKTRQFQKKKKKQQKKTSTSASLTKLKPLCVSQQTGKFLEMGIPDDLTFLQKHLYAGQEATVRTGHGTMNSLKFGKEVCQGCILSTYLFNLYAEYTM